MRNKRKCITIVKGLDLFGEPIMPMFLYSTLTFGSSAVQYINLQVLLTHENIISGVKLGDASKKLGKKFATGASVVKVRISYIDLHQTAFFSLFVFVTSYDNS